MDDNEDRLLNDCDALVARMLEFRDSVRREREADKEAMDCSLKAIAQSRVTLVRCVAWSPLLGVRRNDLTEI
jgi:hypothetical protein